MPIKTVLFDLDGTLADTAPDLAQALNAVRLAHDLPALPFDTIRPVVSHGGRALIHLGFASVTELQAELESLREELLQIYRNNIATHTVLFPGMADLLDELEARDLRWGVVTNKPVWLTDPLMEALELKQRADCIVSGDTLVERKPDPAPLLHACELCGCQTDECLYVGDAERDIEAGRRAGMQTLVALFGYIGQTDRPDSWGANGLVESPEAILQWLDANR
jgi:phosphoglycolate phosphatase